MPAWSPVFGLTSKAAAVLQLIEHGVLFGFVHPCSEVQQRHPRFAECLHLVKDLLSKTVGTGLLHALLESEVPGQVHIADRVSCTYYSDFVCQQCDALMASGALVEWDKVSTAKPQIANGLGVVKIHKGKLRLNLDCSYLNLFLPYEHFKYEQLSDAMEY